MTKAKQAKPEHAAMKRVEPLEESFRKMKGRKRLSNESYMTVFKSHAKENGIDIEGLRSLHEIAAKINASPNKKKIADDIKKDVAAMEDKAADTSSSTSEVKAPAKKKAPVKAARKAGKGNKK